MKRIARAGIGVALAGSMVGVGAVVVHERSVPELVLTPAASLPEPETDPIASSVIVCESRGACNEDRALAVIRTAGHEAVRLSELSPATARAFVAAEDRKFYDHDGIDTAAIARATIANIASLKVVQGGSTIDRQLATLLYGLDTYEELRTNNDPVIRRLMQAAQQSERPKSSIAFRMAQQLRECQYAMALNQAYTKDKILELYLNNAPFGRGTTGISDASRAFFSKPANKLTITEAAALAARLPHPSEQKDLAGNITSESLRGWEVRTANIIRTMQADGYISSEAATTAINSPIVVSPKSTLKRLSSSYRFADQIGARHFVETALDATRSVRVRNGPGYYKIRTTLDAQKQRGLYQSIRRSFKTGQNIDVGSVVLRKDATIAAMVGSRDYGMRQLNLALGTKTGRSAGSSLKPFAAALAMRQGATPETEYRVRSKVKVRYADGRQWYVSGADHCANLRRPTPCTMTITEGLAVSSNTLAAEWIADNNLDNFLEILDAFNGAAVSARGPAVLLGAGNWSPYRLAVMYNGLLARSGESYVPERPLVVLSVDDSTGINLYKEPAVRAGQVLSASQARDVRASLSQTAIYGTASGVLPSSFPQTEVALKTGTATDSTDLWATGTFCAEGESQTISVWAGNPDGTRRVVGYTSKDAARAIGNYIGQQIRYNSICKL